MRHWEDILPADVAKRQRQWDRRAAIKRMRAAGFKYWQIAERFGISEPRVEQICKDMVRRNFGFVQRNTGIPVKKFLESGGDVAGLARKLMRLSRMM